MSFSDAASRLAEISPIDTCARLVMASTEDPELLGIGKAWSYLGLVGLTLYVTTMPFDPAFKPRVKSAELQTQLEDVRCAISIRQHLLRLMTGQDVDAAVKQFKQNESAMENALKALQAKMAYRPERSAIVDLHAEMLGLAQSLTANQTLTSLIDALERTFYT